MIKILLVDDKKVFAKGLSLSLEQEGFEVTKVFDGREAYCFEKNLAFSITWT